MRSGIRRARAATWLIVIATAILYILIAIAERIR
jgi:hypothetical protein